MGMLIAAFFGGVSKTKLSPNSPVMKKAIPATNAAATALLTSILSIRRLFSARS
jgi:hypothetical protein